MEDMVRSIVGIVFQRHARPTRGPILMYEWGVIIIIVINIS